MMKSKSILQLAFENVAAHISNLDTLQDFLVKINGNLGNSVALGDVNGDGYADVGVGAISASTQKGEVYIFLGVLPEYLQQ